MALLFFAFFVDASALADSYVCASEDKSRKVLFTWDNSGIHWERNFFYFRDDSRAKLKGEHHSGDYLITNNDQEIVLTYIQDTVYSLVKRPEGELVDYDSKIIFADIKATGHALVYSATMPNLHIHSFNKHKKSFTLRYQRLPSVRHADPKRLWLRAPYKKKIWLEKGAQRTSHEITDLSAKEIKKAFLDHEDNHEWSYPHCQLQPTLWGKFKHWLKFLSSW